MTKQREKYNRIKIVMTEKEKSYEWLADQLKFSKSTVEKWGTNTNQPTISTLFKIAQILDVKVCELLVSNK